MAGRSSLLRIAALLLLVAVAALAFELGRQVMAPAAGPRFVAGPEVDLRVLVGPDGVSFRLSDPTLPPGIDGRLTLTTAAGPVNAVGTSRSGAIDLDLPQVRAGMTPYRLTVGQALFEGVVERRPGPAVGELDMRIGARAVRVTGERRPAVVVQPLDANGNVAAGPVELRVVRPDGSAWESDLPVRGLIAWSYLPTSTVPGRLDVVALSGQARAERGEVDVLAGDATSGTLDLVRGAAPSNGRDAWQLALADLRDAVGNRAGGVALFAGGSQGDGRLDLFAVRPIVLGEAGMTLPAAPLAGVYSVAGQAGAFVAPPARLLSEAVVLALPPVVWLGQGAGHRLLVGPIVDRLGALPDDGTEVRIRFLDDASRPLLERSARMVAGRVELGLSLLPSDTVRLDLELLGTNLVIDLVNDDLPAAPAPGAAPGTSVPDGAFP